jgi:hypothetical protein
MFGLFKSPPFRDPLLGEFTRSRGYWRGFLSLEVATNVPLVLSGTRTEPDAQAVATARTMASAFASWRPAIALALFEHCAPYAEAIAAGELPPSSEPLPSINGPADVWPHVSLAFVSVTPLEGVFTSEFGFTAAWDEEHTLGARFQEGKFLELCGSVLPP